MPDPSTLRRKIGAPRADAPPPASPSRVWRRAVAHGLGRGLGIDVSAVKVECHSCLAEATPDLIGDGTLAVLLDSTSGPGVALIDTGALSAITEWQTLGKLRKVPPPDRRATETDAAMIADCLDAILAAHQAMAEDLSPPRPPSGFRFATRLAEPRDVAIQLGDIAHDRWAVSLSLGPGGLRAGTMQFILPQTMADPEPVSDEGWSPRLESRVMGSDLSLAAEIGRITLSVERLRALGTGDVLALPLGSVGSVRLVTPQGHRVALGRLGQSSGRKAVRLETQPDAPFSATRPLSGDTPAS